MEKTTAKKLAVIGNGMLGSDLAQMASEAGWTVSIYDLPEFDITDKTQLQQVMEASDCIVNCAAYTNVDKAETEKDLCAAVNAKALSVLGELAAQANKYVVHISTDFVFGDLQDTPQSENDETNPLSVYGATKLEGENNLLDSGCQCAVIRVQWTYGINGNNFISKILELAKKLPQLKVVNDQFGSPTWTMDISRAIMEFLDNKTEGLYHFAASGYATRFDIAKAVAEYFKLDTELTPCDSDEFPAPAARPRNSRFDCSKIDKVLSFKRPEWQESLKKFLNKIS
jgi:dTDP-4-dehydrorhamnose reductase